LCEPEMNLQIEMDRMLSPASERGNKTIG
jgi:hypothetical protein